MLICTPKRIVSYAIRRKTMRGMNFAIEPFSFLSPFLPTKSYLCTRKCRDMLNKLDAIIARFDQVGIALTNPEIINNQKEFGAYSKEYRSLEKIMQPYEAYKKVLADYDFAREAQQSSDDDMKELAKMELPGLEEKKDELEKLLTQLLIPKDPQDDKNAILEIRAGTGGDEASLFAGDLLGMYLRYCSKKGWKTQIVSESEGTVGGYKEVVVEVTGEDVYGTLKFESGVHRVVVVCQTERSQLGNREKAMNMLRTKLYEEQVRKQEDEISRRRKTLVSTGDRSAKIRTYNWPQGRVTDHRIGLTSYNLDAVVNGEIEEFIEALQMAENAEKMLTQ